MILRHIERQPLKSLLTTLGISMACGIMMIGGFQEGAIDHMVDVQFGMSQRETWLPTIPSRVRCARCIRCAACREWSTSRVFAPCRRGCSLNIAFTAPRCRVFNPEAS